MRGLSPRQPSLTRIVGERVERERHSKQIAVIFALHGRWSWISKPIAGHRGFSNQLDHVQVRGQDEFLDVEEKVECIGEVVVWVNVDDETDQDEVILALFQGGSRILHLVRKRSSYVLFWFVQGFYRCRLERNEKHACNDKNYEK